MASIPSEKDQKEPYAHYDVIASMVFVAVITIISIVASLYIAYRNSIELTVYSAVFPFLIVVLNFSAILALGGIVVNKPDLVKRKRNLTIGSLLFAVVGVGVLSVGFFAVLNLNQMRFLAISTVYLATVLLALWIARITQVVQEFIKDLGRQ